MPPLGTEPGLGPAPGSVTVSPAGPAPTPGSETVQLPAGIRSVPHTEEEYRRVIELLREAQRLSEIVEFIKYLDVSYKCYYPNYDAFDPNRELSRDEQDVAFLEDLVSERKTIMSAVNWDLALADPLSLELKISRLREDCDKVGYFVYTLLWKISKNPQKKSQFITGITDPPLALSSVVSFFLWFKRYLDAIVERFKEIQTGLNKQVYDPETREHFRNISDDKPFRGSLPIPSAGIEIDEQSMSTMQQLEMELKKIVDENVLIRYLLERVSTEFFAKRTEKDLKYACEGHKTQFSEEFELVRVTNGDPAQPPDVISIARTSYPNPLDLGSGQKQLGRYRSFVSKELWNSLQHVKVQVDYNPLRMVGLLLNCVASTPDPSDLDVSASDIGDLGEISNVGVQIDELLQKMLQEEGYFFGACSLIIPDLPPHKSLTNEEQICSCFDLQKQLLHRNCDELQLTLGSWKETLEAHVKETEFYTTVHRIKLALFMLPAVTPSNCEEIRDSLSRFMDDLGIAYKTMFGFSKKFAEMIGRIRLAVNDSDIEATLLGVTSLMEIINKLPSSRFFELSIKDDLEFILREMRRNFFARQVWGYETLRVIRPPSSAGLSPGQGGSFGSASLETPQNASLILPSSPEETPHNRSFQSCQEGPLFEGKRAPRRIPCRFSDYAETAKFRSEIERTRQALRIVKYIKYIYFEKDDSVGDVDAISEKVETLKSKIDETKKVIRKKDFARPMAEIFNLSNLLRIFVLKSLWSFTPEDEQKLIHVANDLRFAGHCVAFLIWFYEGIGNPGKSISEFDREHCGVLSSLSPMLRGIVDEAEIKIEENLNIRKLLKQVVHLYYKNCVNILLSYRPFSYRWAVNESIEKVDKRFSYDNKSLFEVVEFDARLLHKVANQSLPDLDSAEAVNWAPSILDRVLEILVTPDYPSIYAPNSGQKLWNYYEGKFEEEKQQGHNIYAGEHVALSCLKRGRELCQSKYPLLYSVLTKETTVSGQEKVFVPTAMTQLLNSFAALKGPRLELGGVEEQIRAPLYEEQESAYKALAEFQRCEFARHVPLVQENSLFQHIQGKRDFSIPLAPEVEAKNERIRYCIASLDEVGRINTILNFVRQNLTLCHSEELRLKIDNNIGRPMGYLMFFYKNKDFDSIIDQNLIVAENLRVTKEGFCKVGRDVLNSLRQSKFTPIFLPERVQDGSIIAFSLWMKREIITVINKFRAARDTLTEVSLKAESYNPSWGASISCNFQGMAKGDLEQVVEDNLFFRTQLLKALNMYVRTRICKTGVERSQDYLEKFNELGPFFGLVTSSCSPRFDCTTDMFLFTTKEYPSIFVPGSGRDLWQKLKNQFESDRTYGPVKRPSVALDAFDKIQKSYPNWEERFNRCYNNVGDAIVSVFSHVGQSDFGLLDRKEEDSFITDDDVSKYIQRTLDEMITKLGAINHILTIFPSKGVGPNNIKEALEQIILQIVMITQYQNSECVLGTNKVKDVLLSWQGELLEADRKQAWLTFDNLIGLISAVRNEQLKVDKIIELLKKIVSISASPETIISLAKIAENLSYPFQYFDSGIKTTESQIYFMIGRLRMRYYGESMLTSSFYDLLMIGAPSKM